MKTPLSGKHILLGVTGSIACYKAADLASKLTQAGAQVDVLLTPSALQFVTPLTFQSVTGRRAYTDADLWGSEGHVQHIGLGKGADLLMIAPASANTLAKLAHGLGDNLLTVTALAATCPLLLAPAMDGGMFMHPATQANLELLRQRGATIVGPASGHLASGMTGVGRMVEPPEVVGAARRLLGSQGGLHGRKVVVTAAGTQEPIDPVRMITNNSSGKQGFALAQAALDLGAEVTLICGPTHLAAPVGAQRVDVRTTQQMLEAVQSAVQGADALIMAAAPADFRPANAAAHKIKKESGAPEIQLEPNPDILKTLAARRGETGWPRLAVGFAAESQNLLEYAQSKLKAKGLEMIVANDVSAADAGFNVDTNRVILLFADGRRVDLPLLSKDEVAQRVMEEVAAVFGREGPILHLVRRPLWEAEQEAGVYRADSLETEGFIHASRPDQILGSANTYYSGQTDMLLLWIDPARLQPELRWEEAHGQMFPHIYGPLNLDAVVDVTPLRADPDGVFRRVK